MYNCKVLHNLNVGKFGKSTLASEKKKKKKTIAHDPGLTPQLVQVHGLGPWAEKSAWDT